MLSKYLPRHLRAPADPVVTPPTPPPPSAEELKAKAKAAVAAMGWGDEEPEPAPDPGAPALPQATTTPPADPAAPPAPAPGAPAAPPDPLELIRQTAEATGKAIAEHFHPPAAAAAPAATPVVTTVDQSNWTDEDKHTYEQLKYLEKTDPDYAGKAEAFVQFLPKLAAYQDDWLAKNPGQAFDPNADEHNDWYAANQTLDADEIENDVRVQKKLEKKLQPITAEMEQKRKQEEAKQKEQVLVDAKATIDGEVTDKVSKLITLTDPTLAEKLKNDKGEVSIGEESQKRVEEADPISARVLKRVAQTFVSPLVEELARMAVPGLDYGFSPKTNPAHARILQFQGEAEKRILAKPLSQQVDRDGKQFVTIERWRALFDQASAGKSPEETQRISDQMEAKYWTIGIDEVQEEIVAFGAARAKEEIAEWKGTAAKQFGKPTPPKPPTPPSNNVQVVAPPTPNNGKPKPPSLSGGSDLVTTPAAGGTDQKSFAERATEKYFSK